MFRKLILSAIFVSTVNANDNLGDIIGLSIEQLQDQVVTSVSKQPENAHEAAAAVFLITDDDIRRSGASSIAEALRLAPGLHVAKLDSNKWSISSRGYSGQFSNKLLVLFDGRSVYTPLFSGVYWDVQDTALEDIDRIEVIRGPGATLWGANAVNGVINIITKSARFTEGKNVTIGFGNNKKTLVSFSETKKLTENSSLRIYGKHDQNGDSSYNNPIGNDDSYSNRMGFRYDNGNTNKEITILGDLYYGENSNSIDYPSLSLPYTKISEEDEEFAGANILLKVKNNISDKESYEFQSYFDFTKRDISILKQDIYTLDFDYQQNNSNINKHDITWGSGYRLITTNIQDHQVVNLEPENDSFNLFSAFIQDKYSIVPNKLFFTYGTKFEYNDFTGFEVQPNARLSWLINSKNTLWASISRAVRTPSINEQSLSLAGATIPENTIAPNTPSGFVKQVGSSSSGSEEVIAYELGFRSSAVENLYLDINAFYNKYDSLVRFDQNGFFTSPDTAIEYKINNNGESYSYGFELSTIYNILDNWSISGSYSYLKINTKTQAGDSFINLVESDQGRSPNHIFNVSSKFNISNDIEFDQILYYVDSLDSMDIDSYFRFDSRLSWKINNNLELSFIGQNLFDSTHQEYEPSIYSVPTEVERSYIGQIKWKF